MKKGRYRKAAAAAVTVLLVTTALYSVRVLDDGKNREKSQPDEKIELSFFLRKRETTHIFEKIVEDFNKSQEEITVRTVIVPNSEVELEIRAISGEFPDIVEMIGSQNENMMQYVQGGYLAPLDNQGLSDRLMDGYKEQLLIDGKIYMVPLSVNFRGLYMNLDLMEQAGYSLPDSYEELLEILQDVKDRGELPMIFPDKDTWSLHQEWDAVDTVERGSQKEAYVKAAKGLQPLWEDKGFLNSVEKYIRLREFGQELSWETGYDEAIRRFAGGEAYMFLQGNWAYSAIKKQNPDIRLTFVPFPAEQGKEPNIVGKLDASIGISASCENHEAALEFLEYVLSEEVMKYYSESTGTCSCIKGGNGDLSFAPEFVEKLERNEFVLDTITIPESACNVRDQGLLKLITGKDADYTAVSFLKEYNDAVVDQGKEILDSVRWETSE